MKIIIIAISILGLLIIVSTLFIGIIKLPEEKYFSEIYLLGPEQMAQNYPFNIIPNQNYSVYLGVGNHLGATTYYIVNVMLLNNEQMFPESYSEISSSIETLYRCRFLIQNDERFEYPLIFSIANVSIYENKLKVGNLFINGIDYPVNITTLWDSKDSTFEYRLIFELWKFNSNNWLIQSDGTWVSLRLNATSINDY